MAGHRIYATIPERDYRLISRLAMIGGECAGMWARRVLLSELYRTLQNDEELLEYDAALARVERDQVLHGR